jgi:hypothetical protein
VITMTVILSEAKEIKEGRSPDRPGGWKAAAPCKEL